MAGSDDPADPGAGTQADAERIAGYLRGDPDVYRTIDGWILRHLRSRYSRMAGQHEDLGQIVHVRLLANLKAGRFEGRSALKSYVGGIVHRVAISRLRRIYRDPIQIGLEAGQDPPAPDDPYRQVESSDQVALYRRVLFSLPALCRRLWKLTFVDELPYNEIARKLSIPPGTVKSRLWRCRQKARTALRRMR